MVECHPQPGGGRSMADIALFGSCDVVGVFAGCGGAVMTIGTDTGRRDTAVIETGIGPDQG